MVFVGLLGVRTRAWKLKGDEELWELLLDVSSSVSTICGLPLSEPTSSVWTLNLYRCFPEPMQGMLSLAHLAHAGFAWSHYRSTG